MKLPNFVKFATSTTGTGDIAIGAADTGFITPAQAGAADGDKFPYVIDDGSDWAFGVGTYSNTGPTLVRDAAEIRYVSGVRSAAKLSITASAKISFDGAENILMHVPKVTSDTSSGTLTPACGANDVYRFTALAANLTVNAPSGTPYDKQRLQFSFKDNGTIRNLTWNAAYVSGDLVLPLSTNSSTITYVEVEYDASLSKWVCTQSWSRIGEEIEEPVFVGSHSVNATATSAMTINFSSLTGGVGGALQEGDIVVVFVAVTRGNNGNVYPSLTTSGYALEGNSLTNGSDGLTHVLQSCFTKRMGSTPDTSVVSVANSYNDSGQVMFVEVWRNTNAAAILDVALANAVVAPITNVNNRPNPPSLTSVNAQSVYIAFGSYGTSNSAALNTPSDLDVFLSNSSTATTYRCTGGGGHRVLEAVGSHDPAAFTGGPSAVVTQGSWVAQAIMLRGKAASLSSRDAYSQVITNKASGTPIVPAGKEFSFYINSLAQDTTVNNPTGVPFNGQRLTIIIRDNGTPRAVAWGSNFLGSLPSSTYADTPLVVDFVWDSVLSKWVLTSVKGVNNPKSLMLAAAEVSTSTTPALISDANGDWSIPMTAGKSYRVNVTGTYRTASSNTGIKLGIYAGGSLTGMPLGQAASQVTAGALSVANINNLGADFLSTPAVPVSNTDYAILASFTFVCTASGTLDFRWGTEVGSSAATLNAGSKLTYQEI